MKMDLRDYIDSVPSILTIAPTHRCTAACRECCFRCTPKIEQVLETNKILRYIDESVEAFPSLKLMVLTGGECFLVANDLPLMISHAKSHDLMSRVVSNGFWATSYEAAIKKLTPLVKAGLTELNISTGDNHQEYVPFENVVNGLRAAYDLGIKSMAVSVESPPNAEFTSAVIKNHTFLAPMIKEGVLFLINAVWMKFSTEEVFENEARFFSLGNYETHKPCTNLFNNIVINPNSQMLACCGLTVEYNKYLKLGEIGNGNSISNLYNSQFTDLFKFWIHVDGPAVIYDKIADIRKIEKKVFTHECEYCIELIRNQDNCDILKTLIRTELPGIIFRQSIRKTSLKIKQ